jgi:hypothetical protein
MPIGDPTAVQVVSFEATGRVGDVEVSWETASEVDTLGFNLYRATKVDGPRVLVNEDLIASQVPPGSTFGAAYTYKDAPAKPGVLYYWLEVMNVQGQTELHGPVSARRLK